MTEAIRTKYFFLFIISTFPEAPLDDREHRDPDKIYQKTNTLHCVQIDFLFDLLSYLVVNLL